MPEFGLRVEDNGEAESGFSPVEKVWSIPLYVVRKIVFYICKFSVDTVAFLSDLFGFRFYYEFSDQPRWNWLRDFSLPRYTLRRKK